MEGNNNSMNELFKDAYERRRNKEFVLTSRLTNLTFYSSAAWESKRKIWPPLSTISNAKHEDQVTDRFASASHSDDHSASVEPVPEHIRRHLDELTSRSEPLYHPLHGGNLVRILELYPGPEQSLKGKFHYANLEHLHQPYQALSYVWGDKTTRLFDQQDQTWKTCVFTIECNGYQCNITPNLYRALQYLRFGSESRFLWVDALCINQDDIQERGHQVTLMSSLYRSATKVLIWIAPKPNIGPYDSEKKEWRGPPPELEDAQAQCAFGAMCDVVNTWRGDNLSYPKASYMTLTQNGWARYTNYNANPPAAQNSQYSAKIRRYLQMRYPVWPQNSEPPQDGTAVPLPDNGIATAVEDASHSQFWLAIAQLFDLPWFWRVWVIQEAILAKAAVVVWTNTIIDWRWVGLAAAILRTKHHAICESMRLIGVYNAYVMYRLSPICGLPPIPMNLIQLLRLTRQFEATDSKDRVYGLLGIKILDNDPSTKQLFLQPDYSLSQAQLWKRLAWKSIKQSGNLSILTSVQYTAYQLESENSNTAIRYRARSSESQSDSGMPSWVPHWGVVYRVTLAPWDISETFAAAKGFPLQMLNIDEAEPDCLRLEAIISGVVAYEGSFMWHDIDYSLMVSGDLGSFFASETGLRLLARTLTAGRNSYGSLTDCTDEPVADLAAHIIATHDCYVTETLEKNKKLEIARRERGYGSDFFAYDPQQDESWDVSDRLSPSLGGLQSSSGTMTPGYPKKRNFRRLFNLYPEFEDTLRRLALNGQASRFCETAIPLCERRRLFLTLNGFLGIGPDTVREGDVIAILSGAEVPFILRPINNPATALDGINRYLLVGECFVDGLMNGEAVKAATSHSLLSGAVPPDSIIQRILVNGNEPEIIPVFATMCEIDRRKRKKERLDQGEFFDANVLEGHVEVRPEKKVIEIVDRAENDRYELGGRPVEEEVFRSMYDVTSLTLRRNSDSE